MIVHGFVQGMKFARPIAVFTAVLTATGIVAIGLFGAVQPAAAQQGFGNFFGYQTNKPKRRRHVRRRRSRSAPKTAEKKKETEAKAPTQPVYVVVSLGDQHISVYDRDGRIARSTISTGTSGHPTPKGVFSVIGKERYHYSNLYGAAPMPWMQRITWSGVAMHAGHVTGRPASHGCIRLPYSFAPKLWKMTKMGARVVVTPRDTVPFDIAHDFLPLPTMRPAPFAPAGSQQASHASSGKIELASLNPQAGVAMAAAGVSDDSAATTKLLNPIAYAKVLKKRAKADKAAAVKAAKKALKAAQAAGAEARQAVADMGKAEADLKAAKERIAELEAKALEARTSQAKDADGSGKSKKSAEAAAMARTAAQSELARARAALDEARRRQSVKTPAAFAAVQAWKTAVATSKKAAKTLNEADRRTEPVSVFVSKKEGRVFIRQDWKEVYEAPVTIRDPERPLGTHVYLAIAAEPEGSAVRWKAITVPESASHRRSRKRSRKKAAEDKAEDKPFPPDTAAGALDRIELPPGARQRISDLLWTGAFLIVSDHPRSYEMDDDTGFIVLTR